LGVPKVSGFAFACLLGASLSMSDRPSYVFVSYSHQDEGYARRLAEALEQEGLSAWIDDRIDYGTQWPRVIEQHLDDCSAFIVIMTPRSYQSDWVQNELNRAKRKGKPIFPLYLEGGEPWLSVETTQYVDVTDGRLPPPDFYERLAQVIPRRTTEGPASPTAQLKLPPPSPSTAPQAESRISSFEHERPELFLWLAWVLASTVGSAVGLTVSSTVGAYVGGTVFWAVIGAVGAYVGLAVLWATIGATFGATFGAMQWPVLRRRIPKAGWWVLATTVGGAVATTVGGAVGGAVGVAVTEAEAVAVGGAVGGAMQWLVLRRRISRAGWWVLASTVGWAVGVAVYEAVLGAVVGAVLGGVVGAVYGAITGGALVWLLRRPAAET
jgi:hypothetical protein